MGIFTGRLPPLFIAAQIATLLALVLAGLLLAGLFSAHLATARPAIEVTNGE